MFLKIINKNNGNILILSALVMTIIMGFAMIAIDYGFLVSKKTWLQGACDAAALAGAKELINDPVSAENVAKDYAQTNSVDLTNTNVAVNETDEKVTVSANMKYPGMFSKIFGINESQVNASATAVLGPINRISCGLRPFGIVDTTFTMAESYTLKFGAGGSEGGNFGALSLDDTTGAQSFGDKIMYGSTTGYSIGDTINTETGNMVNKTYEGISYLIDKCAVCCPDPDSNDYTLHNSDCPRIITVPLIDALDGNTVEIVGFAKFFIETVVKNGGQTEITGRFIERVMPGGVDPDAPDYGAKGVKLIE